MSLAWGISNGPCAWALPMPKLITIYWRDIPAQVIGRAGRGKVRKELDPRFAKAIDRAAMRAGRGSSDAYLDDWRRDTQMVSGDLQQRVDEQVAMLEGAFPDDVLEKTVKAGGIRATEADDD